MSFVFAFIIPEWVIGALIVSAFLTWLAIFLIAAYISLRARNLPAHFRGDFTLRPRFGCPGTTATMNWDVIYAGGTTLTRTTAAGCAERLWRQQVPFRSELTKPLHFSLKRQAMVSRPEAATGHIHRVRARAARDFSGAQCLLYQAGGSVRTTRWTYTIILDPLEWPGDLKVEKIALLAPSRSPLFVVHNGITKELTDADPIATYSDPVVAAGNWGLYITNEEDCEEIDPQTGFTHRRSALLGITMTFACPR
jgi:hypothetical protein